VRLAYKEENARGMNWDPHMDSKFMSMCGTVSEGFRLKFHSLYSSKLFYFDFCIVSPSSLQLEAQPGTTGNSLKTLQMAP
jgi:hypothetical protein